jgi:hypothetical protein
MINICQPGLGSLKLADQLVVIHRAHPRRVALRLCAVLVIGLAPAVAAQTEDQTIGVVKTLSGSATLTRNGVAEPIHTGTLLRKRDRIETGSDGSVGVTFRDNTRIALGPRSRVDLERFVLKPADKQYGFVLRLTRGTLEYISGIIGKLAPEAISIETPTSTIGVRGTRLLARVKE